MRVSTFNLNLPGNNYFSIQSGGDFAQESERNGLSFRSLILVADLFAITHTSHTTSTLFVDRDPFYYPLIIGAMREYYPINLDDMRRSHEKSSQDTF